MRISLEEIRTIVDECVGRVLQEGISDVTYHFCGLQSCLGIVHKDMFLLTMASNRADAFGTKQCFYLSTQRSRSKDLGYAGHMGTCARIQLDGRLLSERYAGRPTDYWGASMGKQNYYNDNTQRRGFTDDKRFHHNFEMEDRIVSYEPFIPNASKYIKRIDIYVSDYDRNHEDRFENVKKTVGMILYLTNKQIPVFVYNDLGAFNSMSPNTNNEEYKYDLYGDKPEMVKYNYKSEPTYKMASENMERNTVIKVLQELMNVYTEGECYRGNGKIFGEIRQILTRFGLCD